MHMEEAPTFRLNEKEMRRQWQQHRQRQYQYRIAARAVIRLAIWILCAYLVREWNPRALPPFLVVSIGLAAVVSAYSNEEEAGSASGISGPAARRGAATASAPADRDDAEDGDEDASNEAHGVAHRAGAKGSNGLRRRGRQHEGAAADGTSAASTMKPSDTQAEAAAFTGALTQPQQRALMLAMLELGTSGATRCAMDPAFRRKLMEADAEDGASAACVCGSGAGFGACCAPVQMELLRILEGE